MLADPGAENRNQGLKFEATDLAFKQRHTVSMNFQNEAKIE